MFNVNDFNDNPGSTGTRPILEPGNHYVRLRKMTLVTPKYDENQRQIQFLFETEPVGEDFEGLFIDKEDEDAGRYTGQVSTAYHDRYAFNTYTTKRGKEYPRDEQIFNYVNRLAKDIGKLEALKEAKVQGEDIDEYVDNAASVLCDPSNYMWITLGGKEWQNGEYVNVRAFLARVDRGAKNVALPNEDGTMPTELEVFDSEKHVLKLNPEPQHSDAPGEQADDSPF